MATTPGAACADPSLWSEEIAAALGISADTAAAHVKSIYLKLGVHDRTAALAEGIRRGIIHLR